MSFKVPSYWTRDNERRYFCFSTDQLLDGSAFTTPVHIPADVPIPVQRHLDNTGEPEGQYNYCYLFIIHGEIDYRRGYFKSEITLEEEFKLYDIIFKYVKALKY